MFLVYINVTVACSSCLPKCFQINFWFLVLTVVGCLSLSLRRGPCRIQRGTVSLFPMWILSPLVNCFECSFQYSVDGHVKRSLWPILMWIKKAGFPLLIMLAMGFCIWHLLCSGNFLLFLLRMGIFCHKKGIEIRHMLFYFLLFINLMM